MAKIKNVTEYQVKLAELNKQGARTSEHMSDRHKHLEGEAADYAQHLHNAETRGRPLNSPGTSSAPATAPRPPEENMKRLRHVPLAQRR